MVEAMEIPKGYKKTEVGIIPEDWEVKKLGEIANIVKGQLITANTAIPDGIPVIGGGMTISYFHNKPNRTGITITVSASGAYAGYVSIHNYPIFASDCSTINESESYDIFFLYYSLLNKQKEIYGLQTGGGQPHVYPEQLRNLFITIPKSKTEQTAIATVLRDTDALIQKLEQLIAKKRNIKTAAMQELLKPKEGWKWTTIEKLGKPFGGLSGKAKADFKDGNCPYIPFMNVMSNPIIDTTYFDYVKISATENQNKAEKGDLFFNSSSETPEEVGMCSVLLEDIPNLYLNSFCFGFRLNKEEKNDGLYLAYFFRSSYGRKIFYILAQGATRHNLSKSDFLKIEIQIPEPDEQVKIATILRDMDNEIQALEKQLEKYKMLKQGMMQVLLTGKIRLV